MKWIQPDYIERVINDEAMHSPVAFGANFKLPGFCRSQLLIHARSLDKTVRFDGAGKINDMAMFLVVLI